MFLIQIEMRNLTPLKKELSYSNDRLIILFLSSRLNWQTQSQFLSQHRDNSGL